MTETQQFLSSLVVAITSPIVFYGIRLSVKKQRQEIVKDLSTIFNKDPKKDGGVVPSFEFLKYKYYLTDFEDERKNPPKDHSLASWIIGALPFCTIVYFFSSIVIESLSHHNGISDFIVKEKSWIVSLAAAFASGYLFSLRGFYRAVNNFDLSPSTFVGSSINLISGAVIAVAASEIIISPVSKIGSGLDIPRYGGFLFAFAVGAMPEVAIRFLLRRSQLKNYKKEDVRIYKSFLTTSVEVIDGIDVEIRERLADYHIRSVQNLATANPLMLFVETPYGVYQIMDWVAQAQLCSSVGPKALAKLWRLGIRTLFDLERAASHTDHKNDALLKEIGKILFDDHFGCDANKTALDNSTIMADIEIRLDDPHVHRLRQIYIQIGERIGNSSKRFIQKSEIQKTYENS